MAMERTGINEDWPAVLDEYGVQFLVLGRHDDSDPLKLFRLQPGWTVDFEDKEAIIFVRADTAQFTNLPVSIDPNSEQSGLPRPRTGGMGAASAGNLGPTT